MGLLAVQQMKLAVNVWTIIPLFDLIASFERSLTIILNTI